jgi:hypothetical protein
MIRDFNFEVLRIDEAIDGKHRSIAEIEIPEFRTHTILSLSYYLLFLPC